MAKRSITKPLLGLAAASAVLASTGCEPCSDDGWLAICGDFGDLAFETPLEGVRWPSVATPESSLLVSSDFELLEVDNEGNVRSLERFDDTAPVDFWGPRSSAPSLGPDGTAFVVLAGAEVRAFDETQGLSRWSSSVPGDAAVAPPTVGEGVVHVSLTTDFRQRRELITLDVTSGVLLRSREGGSAPVVNADGSLVYMRGPQDCGALFDSIVVEEPNGQIRFSHSEPSGIRDFAPGPSGDLYIVAGDQTLVHLSSTGVQEWTFRPDCASCTVAGAPTVTDDAIYFPVWEGAAPRGGCDEPELDYGQELQDVVDPLYALGHDGRLKWSYDGFATLSNRIENMGGIGFFGLVTTPRVKHHPAGRPVVADDGTLYVPTDGGVVALDKNGKELGYVLYNAAQGETFSGDGGLLLSASNPSARRVPPVVMTDDGRVHVWDGFTLRAFATGKAPARIPWTAPFGGNRNAGRVGG